MNPENLQAVMQMQQAMQRLQGTGLVPQGGGMPGMGGAGRPPLAPLSPYPVKPCSCFHLFTHCCICCFGIFDCCQSCVRMTAFVFYCWGVYSSRLCCARRVLQAYSAFGLSYMDCAKQYSLLFWPGIYTVMYNKLAAPSFQSFAVYCKLHFGADHTSVQLVICKQRVSCMLCLHVCFL